jgi:hypothetical protein
MGYEEAWKVLSDLLTDLQKKGEIVPNDIMEDFRSAKTLINLMELDPENIESLANLETYLNNVESYLIFAAQKKCGNEYAEGWMKGIEEARMKVLEKKSAKIVKPVTGVPKGNKWVRVQLSEDVPREYVERLAKENTLSLRTQEGDFLLVYGNNEKLKLFVAQMRQNIKEKKK